MALPSEYRIVVLNETGIDIDSGLLVADIKPYSGDGSGGLSHGTEQTGSNGSTLSNGSSTTLLTVTGSTDIGLNGNANANLSGNTATGANGDVTYYLERSTDGGTSYERDPVPAAVISFDGTNSDKSTTLSV